MDKVTKKWQRYLMKTLFGLEEDSYKSLENAKVSNSNIMSILGISHIATLKNYLKDGRLRGKTVKDIFTYLLTHDGELYDIIVYNNLEKGNGITPLKSEISNILSKRGLNV